MTTLPITHMTLYKHGVGFFRRQAKLNGEAVKISFRVEEMNDILKSLTAIDFGDGQVLGIDYPTPQSRDERLAGCSVHLSDSRSLRDLLVTLRGRHVRLTLDQAEIFTGTLVGIDEVCAHEPIGNSLISILIDETERVQTVTLGRVQGVEIVEEEAANDLRFFLETARGQEDYRQVTIRLTAGEHDLAVSYIAPAPTWRVSYRLLIDQDAAEGQRALLLGWGIFDNRLEEDLEGISLALVAGMPISFVYDLYTPFTPARPVIENEQRVAPGPVEFAGALMEMAVPDAGAGPASAALAARSGPERRGVKSMGRGALARATHVAAAGEAMGELFQYTIATPVTVDRGRSAMAPIVSVDLGYRKDLLYNAAKLAAHPVATLRLKNKSGLTLERGPVTVLQQDQYLGEAILPFTVAGGEIVAPYAVELGVTIHEADGSDREMHHLHIKGAYVHFEEWFIQWRDYQVNNRTDQPVKVLVEHRRQAKFDLFDTAPPVEQTDEHLRFEVEAPARGEVTLRVWERKLGRRREKLRKQSYAGLQTYLRKGLITDEVRDKVAGFLTLWEKIEEHEQELARFEEEREKIYRVQTQIQGNLRELGNTGKEGALRANYVDELEATEKQLKELARRESVIKAQIEETKLGIQAQLRALAG